MKRDNPMIECACGCGQLLSKYDKWGIERRYKIGHQNKGKNGSRHPFFGKKHTEKSRRKMSESLKNHYAEKGHPSCGKPKSEETKAKISNTLKGRFCGEENPFFGEKHTKETREKMSKNHADFSGDKNGFYGRHHTEEVKNKNSEAHLGKKLTEEHKKKISESLKDEKNPWFGRHHTEETKKKISENNGRWNIGKHRSEEVKGKISKAQRGEKSVHWEGGKSFEPYCPKFNKNFKESIREKFNRICFLCSKTEEENGRKLNVHHVNYNKNCLCDDSKCEFVPLCDSCHSKTNINKEYWEETILTKLGEFDISVSEIKNGNEK